MIVFFSDNRNLCDEAKLHKSHHQQSEDVPPYMGKGGGGERSTFDARCLQKSDMILKKKNEIYRIRNNDYYPFSKPTRRKPLQKYSAVMNILLTNNHYFIFMFVFILRLHNSAPVQNYCSF